MEIVSSTLKSVGLGFGILATSVTSSYASVQPSSFTDTQSIFTKPSGSMGINTYWLENTYRSGSISVEKPTRTEISIDKYPDHVEIIKSTFKLTDNELASIINVSRKTLYNWKQKGSEASSTKIRKRIFDLYILARDWIDLGLPVQKTSLETPLFQSLSIKDLLSEKNLDSKKILFAASKLNFSINEDELF